MTRLGLTSVESAAASNARSVVLAVNALAATLRDRPWLSVWLT
jgi:hypothetical protein